MESLDNIQQYGIYVNAVPVEGVPDCWDFVQKDGSKKRFPEFDFYIPVMLTKTYEVHEYVNVSKDERIIPINRQEINPYFIEFGFFEDIKRNRVNNGGELTSAMLNFIRIRRADVSTLNDNDLKKWFNEIGVNEFPWNEGEELETTANDIDVSSFVSGHIVSKAKFLGIDINK